MDQPELQYLRRFSVKSAVKKHRQVLPRAFRPRDDELSLSFTLRCQELGSQQGLIAFRAYHRITGSGDLPGLIYLTHMNLVNDLTPPLTPRYVKDERDPKYGHLHHETDRPDETQLNIMATQASQNGVLLPAIIKGREHPPSDVP